MKGTRKLALLAAGIASALALSACGGTAAPTTTPAPGESPTGEAPPAGEKLQVALVSKGFQHQFWQAVKTGAQQKADELGVDMTFEGPASETEVDAQLNMLQTAIDRKPDAIGYASLDPEACVPLMESAQAAGIPVVQFDAACNSDIPLTLAATDGKAAAALAADKMAELIGGKGKVSIISHSQINQTGVDRRDGFADQIAAKYPDIEIVDIQYGDGDHLKSAEIAKAMIAAHSDLAGIYATNEGSAIGAVNA
ncbi:MAG: substrate-binding domain-containing protein, partial [Propionibacteriaceae bacterium]|nr:substrate-binding domain-containing protein [Propionibacteriaceae bacterium]